MPSPNLMNNQPIITTSLNGTEYWNDRTLQSTFEKPTLPRDEEGSTQTRSRVQPGEEGERFCQNYAEIKKFSAEWDKYWAQLSSVTTVRSGWFWLGVGIAVLGAVALIVVTCGAFLGAAGGAFVTAGGSLIAGAVVAGGLARLVLAGGGNHAANRKSKKMRCALLSPGDLSKYPNR